MNRHIFISTLLLCSAVILIPGEADAQFSLRADLRARSEYRHGYIALPVPDAEAAFFVSQRSRLALGYNADKFTLGLSLQDVRVWGDQELTKDVPSLGLHEAWADISLTGNLGVRIGRQELSYDDQRLLGGADWALTGRSHDAAVLHLNEAGWRADLGGAYNQKTENKFGTGYISSNYKVLAYLWLGKEFSDLKLSLTGITDGYQVADTITDVVYRYTYGGNAEYTTGGFTARATLYGQSGINQNEQTIAAYMTALSTAYRFDNMRVEVAYELLSGTDSKETEKDMTFNTLYATNHKFYGLMDYFLALPRDTKSGGLQDIYATVQYEPVPWLKLRLDGHRFSLASDIADPTAPGQTLDRELGVEIDFHAAYTLTKDITIQGGYSRMFATESMERLKGGNRDETAHWAWLMIMIKPVLFSN